MRRIYLLFLFLISGMVVTCPGYGQDYNPRVAEARQFLEHLVAGEYDQAVTPFDSVLTARMPAEILEQVWGALQKQVGDYKGSGAVRTAKSAEYDVVFLTCHFVHTSLEMKVVFNAQHQIAGLFFVPASGKPWNIPAYADTSLFSESPVEVITGTFHLKGELTIPKQQNAYPVVVLVHGSGPEDMDESISGNKVFKDIAWGLSSRGIAVLRYDKRTLTYGATMNKDSVTVDDEVIRDALSAIHLAGEVKQGTGVYLLGHSLGGYLAPRIAEKAPLLHGLILLAGNARPLEDLVLEQVKYILGLDGLTQEDSLEIDNLSEEVKRVQSGSYSDSTDASQLPLGIPPAYWRSLRQYDPVAVAKTLDMPMLILQGERDYQVTMTDFSRWQQGLQDKPSVSFTSFPGLNHLFMTGTGKSVPDEYLKQGHVSEAVIHRIAEWLKEQ